MIFKRFNTASLVSLDIDMGDLNLMVSEIIKGKQNLLIRSPGGTSNALPAALEFIANKEITTIGDGVVASAALDIFLCGRTRLATPGTCFTFHQSRARYEGRWMFAGEALQLARIASITESYDGGRHFASVYRELSEVDRLRTCL